MRFYKAFMNFVHYKTKILPGLQLSVHFRKSAS